MDQQIFNDEVEAREFITNRYAIIKDKIISRSEWTPGFRVYSSAEFAHIFNMPMFRVYGLENLLSLYVLVQLYARKYASLCNYHIRTYQGCFNVCADISRFICYNDSDSCEASMREMIASSEDSLAVDWLARAIQGGINRRPLVVDSRFQFVDSLIRVIYPYWRISPYEFNARSNAFISRGTIIAITSPSATMIQDKLALMNRTRVLRACDPVECIVENRLNYVLNIRDSDTHYYPLNAIYWVPPDIPLTRDDAAGIIWNLQRKKIWTLL